MKFRVTTSYNLLYLLGALAIATGFVLLARWLRGLRGRIPRQPFWVFAVAVLALLTGALGIGVAIVGVHEEENARHFSYWVTVHPNGTAPVRLLLPAPVDERVFPPLNQTIGTSTLRLNRTGAVPSVEVVATGNVSFEVHMDLIGPPIDKTLSRVSLPDPQQPWNLSASVELLGDGTGLSSAWVDLTIIIGDPCYGTHFNLAEVINEGTGEYRLDRATSVC